MRSGKSKAGKFMALAVCAALIAGNLPGAVFADTGGVKKETSHMSVETSGNAANPGDRYYIAETASNAIKPSNGDVAARNETTKKEYASVQEAVSEAKSGDTVTMIADSKENISVSDSKNIILDLDGHILDGDRNGSVITNRGTLTLIDSSGDNTGCITNGSAEFGGGIYNRGTFTINAGMITDNAADNGAGIYNDGTLTLNGGAIRENTVNGGNSHNGGGGVYNAGTFTMKRGTISDNDGGRFGGGVYNSTNAAFILEGGTISGNTVATVDSVAGRGGGVDTDGYHTSFIMKGGEISGNSADEGGGVIVRLFSSFTMEGGLISENTASDTGGGVYCDESGTVFTMENGTISENKAGSGGGVYNCSTFNMQGGAVCDNIALDFAADIYSGNSASLAIPDAVTMLGNEDPGQCRKWYEDESGNRYYPENITAVYYDENVLNAESPYKVTGDVCLIAAGDEGHIYDEEDVIFTWNGTDSCAAVFICADCEHEETVNCDVAYETVKEATCTEDGSVIYTATAAVTNRDGELTVTDEQTEEIKAPGHIWVETDTETTAGDNTEIDVKLTCSRCGETQDETVVIETVGNGVTAHAGYTWSDIIDAATLGDYFFEKDATIDFAVTVADNNSSVSEADKTLTEEKISSLRPDEEYSVFYLDIGVGMNIYDSTGTLEKNETFDKTINPITFTVTIPDSLKEAAGDTYTVLRIHDGSADELDTTDTGDGTITFASDLFSSYAIVKTAEPEISDTGDEEDTGDEGDTGDEEDTGDQETTGTGTSGSGSSSHSDNDDNDYNNSSSTSESSEGHSCAYVKGTWTIDEYGYWRFTSDTGKRYENEWGYIYNPYADVSAGQPEASRFHFGHDGIMDTGWYTDTDGYIYYLNPVPDNTQGRMFTGWNWIKAGDGRNLCYYFDESFAGGHYGRLYISTTTPDGYTVDETGAWIENGEQVTR